MSVALPSPRLSGSLDTSFELGGHRVVPLIEPEGWLVASVPVSGTPLDLLRRQAAILGPAKVTNGPSLRAETPFTNDCEESSALVCSTLKHGLAVLTEENSPFSTEACDAQEAMRTLTEYLADCSWEWLRDGETFVLPADANGLGRAIKIELEGDRVLFRADLVAIGNVEPVCQRALGHFLLGLNSHLRFARGSILAEQVALEVVMPSSALSTGLIDKAVRSLVVGLRLSTQECTALLAPDVGRAYCEFHEVNLETERR